MRAAAHWEKMRWIFYWLHRDDPEKPAEEIVDILEELKKEGPDPLLWIFPITAQRG